MTESTQILKYNGEKKKENIESSLLYMLMISIECH